MTAGRGVLHKEMHSPEFSQRGGRFEVLQLWVNLPARSKMHAAGYQSLAASEIPTVCGVDGVGGVRVIAGGHNTQRSLTPAIAINYVH